MHMSDLQAKDIINIKDGKNIGKISDIVIDETGNIEYLVIAPTKLFKRYSFTNGETNIRFNQIIKFGNDVILVEL